MKTELERVLPQEIEARSFEIITVNWRKRTRPLSNV